jgi:hypothetical protein
MPIAQRKLTPDDKVAIGRLLLNGFCQCAQTAFWHVLIAVRSLPWNQSNALTAGYSEAGNGLLLLRTSETQAAKAHDERTGSRAGQRSCVFVSGRSVLEIALKWILTQLIAK